MTSAEPEAPSLTRRSIRRFVVVGVVNTALDVLIYLWLRQVGLPVALANLISTSAGMTFSFLANRHFTFRRSGGEHHLSPARQALVFLCVTGFGLWVLQPIVILAVTAGIGGATKQLGFLAVVLPKLCAVAVGMIWNFTLYSKVVFRHRAEV